MALAISFSVLGPVDTGGDDPFPKLATSLEAARVAAPDDLQADLATLTAAFAAVARRIEDAGGWVASSQAAAAELVRALEPFSTPQ